jgi:hypothetical protein
MTGKEKKEITDARMFTHFCWVFPSCVGFFQKEVNRKGKTNQQTNFITVSKLKRCFK